MENGPLMIDLPMNMVMFQFVMLVSSGLSEASKIGVKKVWLFYVVNAIYKQL